MSEIVQFSKRKAKASPQPLQSPTSKSGEFANIRIMRGHFVFDERRGSFHRVSETAAFVLAALKQNHPLERIIADYAHCYGISAIVAQRDVELFINDLPGVGLRRPAADAPPAQRKRRHGPRLTASSTSAV